MHGTPCLSTVQERRYNPQPQDPGGRLSCGPPWTKRMWNVSLFIYIHLITYYCNDEVQSSVFSAFHGHISHPLIFCSSCVCPAEVTLALLDAATDKDSKVQEQVRKSILTLGKQQPDRVLAMCQDYLLKHPKVKRTPVSHPYEGNPLYWLWWPFSHWHIR